MSGSEEVDDDELHAECFNLSEHVQKGLGMVFGAADDASDAVTVSANLSPRSRAASRAGAESPQARPGTAAVPGDNVESSASPAEVKVASHAAAQDYDEEYEMDFEQPEYDMEFEADDGDSSDSSSEEESSEEESSSEESSSSEETSSESKEGREADKDKGEPKSPSHAHSEQGSHGQPQEEEPATAETKDSPRSPSHSSEKQEEEAATAEAKDSPRSQSYSSEQEEEEPAEAQDSPRSQSDASQQEPAEPARVEAQNSPRSPSYSSEQEQEEPAEAQDSPRSQSDASQQEQEEPARAEAQNSPRSPSDAPQQQQEEPAEAKDEPRSPRNVSQLHEEEPESAEAKGAARSPSHSSEEQEEEPAAAQDRTGSPSHSSEQRAEAEPQEEEQGEEPQEQPANEEFEMVFDSATAPESEDASSDAEGMQVGAHNAAAPVEPRPIAEEQATVDLHPPHVAVLSEGAGSEVVDKSAPAYQEIETQSPEAHDDEELDGEHVNLWEHVQKGLGIVFSEADDASDALTVSANGTPRSRAASRAASRAGADTPPERAGADAAAADVVQERREARDDKAGLVNEELDTEELGREKELHLEESPMEADAEDKYLVFHHLEAAVHADADADEDVDVELHHEDLHEAGEGTVSSQEAGQDPSPKDDEEEEYEEDFEQADYDMEFEEEDEEDEEASAEAEAQDSPRSPSDAPQQEQEEPARAEAQHSPRSPSYSSEQEQEEPVEAQDSPRSPSDAPQQQQEEPAEAKDEPRSPRNVSQLHEEEPEPAEAKDAPRSPSHSSEQRAEVEPQEEEQGEEPQEQPANEEFEMVFDSATAHESEDASRSGVEEHPVREARVADAGAPAVSSDAEGLQVGEPRPTTEQQPNDKPVVAMTHGPGACAAEQQPQLVTLLDEASESEAEADADEDQSKAKHATKSPRHSSEEEESATVPKSTNDAASEQKQGELSQREEPQEQPANEELEMVFDSATAHESKDASWSGVEEHPVREARVADAGAPAVSSDAEGLQVGEPCPTTEQQPNDKPVVAMTHGPGACVAEQQPQSVDDEDVDGEHMNLCAQVLRKPPPHHPPFRGPSVESRKCSAKGRVINVRNEAIEARLAAMWRASQVRQGDSNDGSSLCSDDMVPVSTDVLELQETFGKRASSASDSALLVKVSHWSLDDSEAASAEIDDSLAAMAQDDQRALGEAGAAKSRDGSRGSNRPNTQGSSGSRRRRFASEPDLTPLKQEREVKFAAAAGMQRHTIASGRGKRPKLGTEAVADQAAGRLQGLMHLAKPGEHLAQAAAQGPRVSVKPGRTPKEKKAGLAGDLERMLNQVQASDSSLQDLESATNLVQQAMRKTDDIRRMKKDPREVAEQIRRERAEQAAKMQRASKTVLDRRRSSVAIPVQREETVQQTTSDRREEFEGGFGSKDESLMEVRRTNRRAITLSQASSFVGKMKALGDGNIGVAWRRHFDSDGDGELSFAEFCSGLARVNHTGDVVELWQQFAGNAGHMSLQALDPISAMILEKFAKWCADFLGGPIEVFRAIDTDGSDSLTPDEFAEGLRELGFFEPENLESMPESLHSEELVLENLYPLMDQNGRGNIQAEQLLFLEKDVEKKEELQKTLARQRQYGYEAALEQTTSEAQHMLEEHARNAHWDVPNDSSREEPRPKRGRVLAPFSESKPLHTPFFTKLFVAENAAKQKRAKEQLQVVKRRPAVRKDSQAASLSGSDPLQTSPVSDELTSLVEHSSEGQPVEEQTRTGTPVDVEDPHYSVHETDRHIESSPSVEASGGSTRMLSMSASLPRLSKHQASLQTQPFSSSHTSLRSLRNKASAHTRRTRGIYTCSQVADLPDIGTFTLTSPKGYFEEVARASSRFRRSNGQWIHKEQQKAAPFNPSRSVDFFCQAKRETLYNHYGVKVAL